MHAEALAMADVSVAMQRRPLRPLESHLAPAHWAMQLYSRV